MSDIILSKPGSKHKANPLYIFYAIIIVLILIIRIFVLPKKSHNGVDPDNSSGDNSNVGTGNTGGIISNDSGNSQHISADSITSNIFNVNHETCEFSGLGGFKYVDVYSGEVRNPERDYENYTKKLKITPGFQEAFLCVVTNVVESVRIPGKTYYLFVIFGNDEYGGVVNVGKVPGGNYYDYKSSKTHPELDGRMYGEDLLINDKSYWLDLKQGFWVADNKTYIRKIMPIQKLNGGDLYINIGGNLSNGTNGIIKKFRIFYKGGGITSN